MGIVVIPVLVGWNLDLLFMNWFDWEVIWSGLLLLDLIDDYELVGE